MTEGGAATESKNPFVNADAVFDRYKQLRAEGKIAEARLLLQDALRRSTLNAEHLDRAGRLLLRSPGPGSSSSETKPLSIRIFGQCTTSWFIPALTAIAWGQGRQAVVSEGGYDQMLQGLSALAADPSPPPEVIVLLPWNQRLLARDDRPAQARIDSEATFLKQAWELVRRAGSRLVQVGYDLNAPGVLGHHLASRAEGPVDTVRQLNERLRRELPEHSYFVDLERVSGELGREQFYDDRSYFWTKQPFSRSGLVRLCEHVWAGIRAVTTGPKKVLVLDLDNTLWGGVVGETGALGIGLGDSPEGEAFRYFQHEVRELGRRGVVLAVCSKNNIAQAREAFERNSDMVLKLTDFAAFEATWDSKPVALQRIAETLRLGLESFVFFDDNPAEREHVLQALPQVSVVDVPPDPCDYSAALHRSLYFESVALTAADRSRVDQYRDEQLRREVQQSAGSVEEYLASLQMVADVRPLHETDMARAVQLLAKTNQFNVTTRRHTAESLRQMLSHPGSVGMTLRLKDRFGDNGLVSLLVAVPVEDALEPTLYIETWLMSCRVIGRGVEDFTMNQLVALARRSGYGRLTAEFIPTVKNMPVEDLYEKLGFLVTQRRSDGSKLYAIDLESYRLLPTSVSLSGRQITGSQ